MFKDINLVQQFSDGLSSPIPALRAVKNLGDAVAPGFEKGNASAIVRALEKETNVEV